MPEYTYIDTRVLWLLMFLSTGCIQYLLIGAVRLVIQLTRERRTHKGAILTLEDFRREEKTHGS